MSRTLQDTARTIFQQAMHAVDVQAAVRGQVSCSGGELRLAQQAIPLDRVDEVFLVALGKAAVPMYSAAAEALTGLPWRAVVVAPPETLPRAEETPSGKDAALFLPGAHPTPTADSLLAAAAILRLLEQTTPRTVVLFLVSGGASAMMERLLPPDATLEDLAAFSRALVSSGLTITEMNTLRKHLSAVKGGRLAVAAAAAAMQCTLLVSDVPDSSPNAVGSGPSLPDTTTRMEALLLMKRLQQTSAVPASIARWFSVHDSPDTPKADHPAFQRAHWRVVLSGGHLVDAALRAAQAAGCHVEVDNHCDDWDYREAADYLLERAFQLATQQRRTVCLICVGEVGVTISGAAGQGGRNQQFALWCAQALARSGREATVLSAGTDGVDGHSTAAGAVCDELSVERASIAGYDASEALGKFNTYPLLQAIGEAIITGPTGNNLRDVRLILVEP